MKNKTLKNWATAFVGFTLISCGVQTGYTEIDGVYYDPNSDKIEQKVAWQAPRQQGYDHNESIIGQSQKTQNQQDQRFNNKNWGNNQKISTSDWGTYTGTENNYYYDSYYTWGHPYYNSFYSPYSFGYYNSYFGHYHSGWSLGFGYTWGEPWRHYYYPSYYWGYNNYYRSPYYYDPFYPGYYYGHPRYYGYIPQYRIRNYRRSSPDTVYRGNHPSSSNNNWGTRVNTTQPQPNYNNYGRRPNWGNNTQTIPQRTNTPNTNNSWNRPSSPNNSSNSGGGFGRQSNWGKR